MSQQAPTTATATSTAQPLRGAPRPPAQDALFRPVGTDRAEPPTPSNPAPLSGVMQAKLTVGAADGPLERQAEHIANHQVTSTAGHEPVSPAATRVNRQCNTSKKQQDQHELQAARAGSAPIAGVAPAVRQVLTSAGQPLDPETRALFEARFGADFSAVRIHHDQRATDTARQLHAHAYTVGDHIVFAADHTTISPARRRLLAHELAHVVQQRRPTAAPPDTQSELAADDAANRVLHGLRAGDVGATAMSPARKDDASNDPFSDAPIVATPSQFKQFRGSSLTPRLSPGTVTVVVVEASWCKPCHTLMDVLSQQASELPQDAKVQYLAVDIEDPANAELLKSLHATEDPPYFYIFAGTNLTQQSHGYAGDREIYRQLVLQAGASVAKKPAGDEGSLGMPRWLNIGLSALGGAAIGGGILGVAAALGAAVSPIGALAAIGGGLLAGAVFGKLDPFGLSARTKNVSTAEADDLITEKYGRNISLALVGCTLTGRKAGYPACIVKIVPQKEFDAAFATKAPSTLGQTPARGKINGFVDSNTTPRTVWINKDGDNPGTMIHEGLHAYSSNDLLKLFEVKGDKLSSPSNMVEGITEYLTRQITDEQRIDRSGHYDNQYSAVKDLVNKAQCDKELLDAYFHGESAVDALKKKVDTELGKGAFDRWFEATATTPGE